MATEVAHVVEIGIAIRVGNADAWAATCHLPGVVMRIGTEEHRVAAKSVCITCGDHPSHGRGERP
jgi:hypothetical protein